MARIGGLTISFSAEGETDSILLPPGRWVLDMQCGGSTLELQTASRSGIFRTQTLLDDTTETSDDQFMEVAGGLEYRADVTTYVGAGVLDFTLAGK